MMDEASIVDQLRDRFRQLAALQCLAEVARQPLQSVPVARFEQGFGVHRGFAEDPVVPVETLEHGLRDIKADLR